MQHRRSELHHIVSANQTHRLHMTLVWLFCALCSYVPINLVLCILLCIKIIVQVCAFIGLLAGTFVCWGLFCWAESTLVAIGNSNCGRGYSCVCFLVFFLWPFRKGPPVDRDKSLNLMVEKVGRVHAKDITKNFVEIIMNSSNVKQILCNKTQILYHYYYFRSKLYLKHLFKH